MSPNPSLRKIGDEGEDIASRTLQRKGYKILARNYRNRYGEIDIIAENRGVVCFVEVKARSSEGWGFPQEAVSRPKQAKIERVALSFLQQHRLDDRPTRFDVVAVMFRPGSPVRVEVFPDAFQAAESS